MGGVKERKKKSKSKPQRAKGVDREVLLEEMQRIEQGISNVFCLTCNQYTNHLSQGVFYSTQEKARKALKEKANNMRYNMGVRHVKETDDSFSFIFGWEEAQVVWQVIEIRVN